MLFVFFFLMPKKKQCRAKEKARDLKSEDHNSGTSLVAQQLKLHAPRQRARFDPWSGN